MQGINLVSKLLKVSPGEYHHIYFIDSYPISEPTPRPSRRRKICVKEKMQSQIMKVIVFLLQRIT